MTHQALWTLESVILESYQEPSPKASNYSDHFISMLY